MNRNKVIWWICCGLVVLLAGLVFSPLVVASGQTEPRLGSIPYTLWMGFLFSFLLLSLTIIGVIYYPHKEQDS